MSPRASRSAKPERRGRKPGPTYRILDPAALAAAITNSYQPGPGARARAAASVGLSDDTLAKLERGEQQAVSWMTWELLDRLVRPEDRELLESAIMPRAAFERMADAIQFAIDEYNLIAGHEAFPAFARQPRESGDASSPRNEGGDWLTHEWEAIEDRIAKGQPPYPAEEESFWRRMLEYALLMDRVQTVPGHAAELYQLFSEGHRVERIWLAWARTVAPLLDYLDTGLIERAWWEMSDEEIDAFLVAGLKRERILLNRPVTNVRAQQVVADRLEERRPSFMDVYQIVSERRRARNAAWARQAEEGDKV